MAQHPEPINPDQCVLMVGGPGDGFDLYGPFDTEDDAISYAEHERFQDSWWVVPLHAVQCDDDGNWL